MRNLLSALNLTVMNARTAVTTALIVSAVATSACTTVRPPSATPEPPSVVIYANLEINSGAPRPGQACLTPTYPSLRVWGDGLAFVSIADSIGSASAQRFSGNLSQQQVDDLLNDLAAQGFFSDSLQDSANPAADYLHIGASRQGTMTRHTLGDLQPAFYVGLVAKLKSLLQLLTSTATVNSRIKPLLVVQCSTAAPQ
jgi:hypothetical protein